MATFSIKTQDLPSRGTFKLSSCRFALVRAGEARDLLETIYGGWLDEPLWDKYGMPIDAMDDAACAELKTYRCVARRARQLMRVALAQSRSGTPWRIASAVLDELASGGVWSVSARASECGCRHTEFATNLHGVYLLLLARARRDLCAAMTEYRQADAGGASKPRRNHATA